MWVFDPLLFPGVDFVKRSVGFFRHHCPHAITDGLFRVDVFQTRLGELVVNEFESLDAVYYCGRDTSHHVTNFLCEYWVKQLTKIGIIEDLIIKSSPSPQSDSTIEHPVIRTSRKRERH